MNQTQYVDHLPNDADGLFHWAFSQIELDLDRSDRRSARRDVLYRLIKFFRSDDDDERPTVVPWNQSNLRITSLFQRMFTDEFHRAIVPSSSILHFNLFVPSLHSSNCSLGSPLSVFAKFRLEFVDVHRGDRSARPNFRPDLVSSNHRVLPLLFAAVAVPLSDVDSQLRINLRSDLPHRWIRRNSSTSGCSLAFIELSLFRKTEKIKNYLTIWKHTNIDGETERTFL